MSNLHKLVTTYFKGVDEEDFDLILGTLHEDCVFSVETHSVRLKGHAEIAGMFARLWADHATVLHNQFHFVEADNGRDIAVRFQVTNTHHDGTLVHKSNCNFFTVEQGRFSSVRVYMSGENTLKNETGQPSRPADGDWRK
jgi:ketosteroid isomerase-like protein